MPSHGIIFTELFFRKAFWNVHTSLQYILVGTWFAYVKLIYTHLSIPSTLTFNCFNYSLCYLLAWWNKKMPYQYCIKSSLLKQVYSRYHLLSPAFKRQIYNLPPLGILCCHLTVRKLFSNPLKFNNEGKNIWKCSFLTLWQIRELRVLY